MKKYLLLASLALAVVGRVSATTYTDVNPADVRLDASTGSWVFGHFVPNALYNPSYTGEFTLAGYNPALEQIVSGSVSFLLWDAALIGGPEAYTISLADMTFSGGSFAWTLSLSSGLSGSALIDLSADGALSYTVTANSGSFWLYEASISADSAPIQQPPTNSVPEASTSLILLGAGLLSVAAIRRKFCA